MKWMIAAAGAVCLAAGMTAAPAGKADATKVPGYKNTPIIPGTEWHVHDPDRPQPKQVKGECKTTPAPEGAIVIFDGKNLDKLKNKKWQLTEDGAMFPPKKAGTQSTVDVFGSCELHLEFMIPLSCCKGNQSGNSGVFFMGRYELQVLNGWESLTYADGTVGALYGQTPPLVKACNPPDEWNSYDVTFTAPKFKDGKLVSPARITAYLNGILVQDDTEIMGATTHKRLPKYSPHGKGPLNLQDHGDPVHYRNIWIKPIED